jgi:hypothetical protein
MTTKTEPVSFAVNLDNYFRAIAEGRYPTAEAINAFASTGMTAQNADNHIARLRSVADLRWQAGTPEEREQAVAELERANRVEQTEGAAIHEQINALQLQLDALKLESDQARQRVESQKKAVSRLKRLYPVGFDSELQTIATLKNAGGVSRRRRELEAARRDRQKRIGTDIADAVEYLGGTLTAMGKVGIDGAAAIARLGHCQPGTANHAQALSFFKANWEQYLTILRDELAMIENELADLVEEFESNWQPYETRREEILSWYVPKGNGEHDPYDDAL